MPATGEVTTLTHRGHVGDFTLSAGKIVIAQDSLEAPADLYLLEPNGRAQLQLTHANVDRARRHPDGKTAEPFTFTGLERRDGARLRRQALRLEARVQISGRLPDPRRTAWLVRRRLDLSLEPAA